MSRGPSANAATLLRDTVLPDVDVPMVNLAPLLEITAAQWKRNLELLFAGGQFVLGNHVSAFENEFAAEMGGGYAVGVGSGTSALELCLRACGITNPKQEVITSALTSPFTALAIRAAGARPVFADVDPETLLIDPWNAEGRLTKRTAALLPVHLYGQACDLIRLRQLSRSTGVELVQDACQAHGARFRGRPLADYSPWVAHSFYPTKNLGCLGDGGAVVTSSPRRAAKLKMLRDGGRKKDQVSRFIGINSRLDEIQAGFLRAFLPRLAEWNAHRAILASLYDQALSDCAAVRPVVRSSESVNHLYVIRVPSRTRLRAYLASHGIQTAVHYPVPLHLQPAFADCGLKRGDLPNAEHACREILSLPLWPYMPESAPLAVAALILRFYANSGGRR